MLAACSNTTTVGRLRVKTRTDQQRLRHILSNATLSPPSLPTSAILTVRNLADPLPARLRLNRFNFQPDPLWQKAMLATLESLLAQAVRPVFKPVPAAAPAVLFLDRAEMLACMGLDWLTGTLARNWWWREFFRNADPVVALLKEWISAPQFVPAALSLLSKRNSAVGFVRNLPQQTSLALLQATVRTFAIPVPAVAANPTVLPVRGPEPQVDGATSTRAKLTALLTATRPRDPWLPWIPEASAPALSPVQRVLLAQALMLVRSPAQARRPEFQERLFHWQTTEAEGGSAAAETEAPFPERIDWRQSDLGGFACEQNQQIEMGLPDTHNSKDADPVSSSAGTVDKTKLRPSYTPAKPSLTPTPTLVVAPICAAPDASAGSLISDPDLPVVEVPASPHNQVTAAAFETPDRLPGMEMETQFGGCFFLLNVFLHLNLYSDFTAPLGKNLQLNIWDLLALVAEEFIRSHVVNDVLWTILANLSGRAPEERPGALFRPPLEWHLPGDWRKAFPEAYEPQTESWCGRLVSIHPAGFALLDLPNHAVPEMQPPDPLHRWIVWFADYLRARLLRAVGQGDAVELLCRQSARVAFTETHVNVTFSLNNHPIELRLAGLDRDPGWIPAAGRYVTFHFE